jgi:hypothetical protein
LEPVGFCNLIATAADKKTIGWVQHTLQIKHSFTQTIRGHTLCHSQRFIYDKYFKAQKSAPTSLYTFQHCQKKKKKKNKPD